MQVSGEENLEGPSRLRHNCNPLQSEVRDPVVQMWTQLRTLISCQEKKQQSQRASLKSTEGRDQGVSMEGTGAQQRGRDIQ